MPPLPTAVFRLAHRAHGALAAARRRGLEAMGVARPLRVVPYRGYGTGAAALLKARVIEDAGSVAPSLDRGLVGGALASLRRFDTVEIPDARVRATFGGRSFEGRGDAEGFLDLRIELPHGLEPGWHEATLELLEPRSAPPVAAPFLVVGEGARFGVVTDVDDTVIVTDVRNRLRRAYALFLAEARERLPFPGVAELYRALHEGAGGHEGNPIVYVSSSPWNLYDHLEWFNEVHGLPPGPILLRDWGLSATGFAPDGRHEHKLDKVRAVLGAFPDLPFVLVGDSSQHDAEHYATLVEEAPGRVPAVYIRSVPARPGRAQALEALGVRFRAAGSELVVVGDSAELAAHVLRLGLVSPQGAAAVRDACAGS